MANPLLARAGIHVGGGRHVDLSLRNLMAGTPPGYTSGYEPGAGVYRIWVAGCAHVDTDDNWGDGVKSLARAIQQSQGDSGDEPFDWDIMLYLGDASGYASGDPADRIKDGPYPTDGHGQELGSQLAALSGHSRGAVYFLGGNHDGAEAETDPQPSYQQQQDWWMQYWVDETETGGNQDASFQPVASRPYAITGTWDAYYFDAGNLRIFMMSDHNAQSRWLGGREGRINGHPAGSWSAAQWSWLQDQIANLPSDKMAVIGAHHMLYDTTTATGTGEGVTAGYHGSHLISAEQDAEQQLISPELKTFLQALDDHASYLYFVGETGDKMTVPNWLESLPTGRVALWLGAHTHLKNPTDTYNGRSPIERSHGNVVFCQCAALTEYHAGGQPMSRLFTFVDGSDVVQVDCYRHTGTVGWQSAARTLLPLPMAFSKPS